jgi:Fe2+ transport system protein B
MSFLSKLSDTVLGVFGKDTKVEEHKEVKKLQEEVEIVEEVKELKKEEIEIKENLEKEVEIEEEVEEIELLSEIDALKKELSDAFDHLSSMDEYWDAIIAIEAVATSCASSDKDFSDAERKEIEIFMQKITQNKEVPSSIQEKIDEVYANPLPLNQAFLLAKETKVEMSVFEDIIEVVMHTDGVKFEEKVVLQAWHDFKQSA